MIPAAAVYRATLVRKLLEKWIKTYLDVLRKEDRKFLLTNLRLNKEPWSLLYLLFKVHKVLLKTRPIVSYCGKLLHPLGQLITEWLQPLARMQKSYFQDSFTLKKELDLQKIPSNARLFICDATSMYTNIKTSPALHRIGQFSRENEEHLTLPTAEFYGRITPADDQQCLTIWGHILATESGDSNGSSTSASLGHNLLRHSQGDIACTVRRQTPTVSSLD